MLYGIRGGVSSSERIRYFQQNSIAEKRAVLHVVCLGSFYLIWGGIFEFEKIKWQDRSM